MIALVGGAEAGELLLVGHPVELSGIHKGPAHRYAVAVHVFRRGMGDNVRAPLHGAAAYRGGEGVVYDQGHAVGVGSPGELLDVQHRQGRVGDGLAEDRLGVGAEGGVQLFLRAVGGDESGLNAHFGHGDGDEVEGAAINGGRGDDVVAAGGDVEQGEEVGRLAGGGQHSRRAALQRGDFRRHIVAGGVLETGVKIAVGLQVEKFAHILGGGVLKGGGLHNGNLTGFAAAGGIASLDAGGFDTVIAHTGCSFPIFETKKGSRPKAVL